MGPSGGNPQQGSINMPAPTLTGPPGTGSQQDSSEKTEPKENETGINIPDVSDYEKPPSPAVVVYIIDPFSTDDDYGERSMSTLALLKSFAEIQQHVQGDLKKNIILQVCQINCYFDNWLKWL